MTKARKKQFDCVEVKRRAQGAISKELEGHSPKEQYETIRQLAEDLPLWKELVEGRQKTGPHPARAPSKRRKAG